jgi:hypothetical protein
LLVARHCYHKTNRNHRLTQQSSLAGINW